VVLGMIFDNIDKKLLEKFKRFHLENPGIYKEFRFKAYQIKATNRKKYSGWTIINSIRWDHDVSSTGDVFKINNDFIALYVRLLIYHDPSFSNFFELRTMKESNRLSSDNEKYRRQVCQL
jgi:hypothetical protein